MALHVQSPLAIPAPSLHPVRVSLGEYPKHAVWVRAIITTRGHFPHAGTANSQPASRSPPPILSQALPLCDRAVSTSTRIERTLHHWSVCRYDVSYQCL